MSMQSNNRGEGTGSSSHDLRAELVTIFLTVSWDLWLKETKASLEKGCFSDGRKMGVLESRLSLMFVILLLKKFEKSSGRCAEEVVVGRGVVFSFPNKLFAIWCS